MPTAVVFDEQSFYALKRQMEASRLEAANLRNRIARLEVGSRGSYLPWQRRISFRNDAGESVPRWGVMRVTGGSAEEYITTSKPNSSFQRLYTVNLDADIAPGKFGLCTFLTAETLHFADNYVLYNTANTPAVGESWGPAQDSWSIGKNGHGFVIIGGHTGSISTTARVAAVQIVPGMVLGKADASIANGASGDVTVWGGTPGSESSTGLSIASCYNRGIVIAQTSTFVRVTFNNNIPYVSHFAGDTSIVGKADAAIALNATSGTVSVWTPSFGSDTTVNVTNCHNFTVAITSGQKVSVTLVDGTHIVTPLECAA